jgi:hypothetical protein
LKRIAVCFFGITRSLKYTHESIEEKILRPARNLGEVRVFAHFFDQKVVSNRRTREYHVLDSEEFKLLDIDFLQVEEPEECLNLYDFSLLKSFGDTRRDGFQSLRNLVHALHSQKCVGVEALKWRPDLVIFLRPDLLYHDSFAEILHEIVSKTTPGVTIPDWQHWRGGYNDRFSICVGETAIRAYSQRVDKMHLYCREMREALHSESLLKYSLDRANITISYMTVRASRIRADGRVQRENFVDSKFDLFKTFLRKARRRLKNIPHL